MFAYAHKVNEPQIALITQINLLFAVAHWIFDYSDGSLREPRQLWDYYEGKHTNRRRIPLEFDIWNLESLLSISELSGALVKLQPLKINACFVPIAIGIGFRKTTKKLLISRLDRIVIE